MTTTSVLAVPLPRCCVFATDILFSRSIIMLHHAGVPQECTEAAAEDEPEPD